ncbi:H(+)/Cl(-) exchange transporter 5-like [Teratosphaeria destructans]|uniref:Chloride channel protein n=1 Tax=Teratosphaeria destructans TaxID=418781 RepID=A0A9W7W1Q9_9PEZI|nr:H(+)/Cl(-) exchange transporter 5-like [Teratosphaeria destructans]
MHVIELENCSLAIRIFSIHPEDERRPSMAADERPRPEMAEASERSPLLAPNNAVDEVRRVSKDRRLSRLIWQDEEASSITRSHVTTDEQKLADSSVGERLPYNDYTTIDWLHDLVKDSYRLRFIHSHRGLRYKALKWFDEASGWIAAAIIGCLTACIAFCVDVAEATVSDWKQGYCTTNIFHDREACCEGKAPLVFFADTGPETGANCPAFREWADSYAPRFAIYVGSALVFGVISSSATMLTKRSLPAVSPSQADKNQDSVLAEPVASGKIMYMAAGSGIPEIKTILSGFVIPNFLDFKVLCVKAFGAIFAVATGMCLGKEGPFVHISTCVGYLIARLFPKYRENGRKMREMLSAACASGLSVAFGAPIGGVLFSYEEISTYFPRKVLWRAFLGSMCAAITLKALNPTGTGKLVLFETHYGTSYSTVDYLVFVVLGVAGGIFGGLFCRLNFIWSRWFRSFAIIKNYPVFEVFLVVLATTLLQYPNPVTREPGDIIIKNLLVDCRDDASSDSWVCMHEAREDGKGAYVGFLAYGTLVKLALTIVTFGIKVPSGVIIPALDAGAFFGRLIGQSITTISPGIFAMVGAAAFLAGVSRMTISLCVIMFELTGELEYVLPHMIAILVAKWVADALGKESVYDLAQTVLGHPFLDGEHALQIVQHQGAVAAELVPPKQTMEEITVVVPGSNKVPRTMLEKKLERLKSRGLMDAGLVLVQNGSMLQGYIAEGELEFGLSKLGEVYPKHAEVRLLGDAEEGEFDLSHFVDRTPICISEQAPMEYVVEMFGKLGLRHLMVVEEGTSRLVGVIIKKRLILGNASQAIAFRFPDHLARAQSPELLTHRSGDGDKAVLISTYEPEFVRLSGDEADSTSAALANLLTTTEIVLEEVINAWDARNKAGEGPPVEDDADASEIATPAKSRKTGGQKRTAADGPQTKELQEPENSVAPPSTKKKPGRPKKAAGKRGRPRKSVA